jgi:hypothetical protein
MLRVSPIDIAAGPKRAGAPPGRPDHSLFKGLTMASNVHGSAA